MHHAHSTPGLSDSIKVYLSRYLTVLTHIGKSVCRRKEKTSFTFDIAKIRQIMLPEKHFAQNYIEKQKNKLLRIINYKSEYTLKNKN
jgi:hypothetical protein